VPGLRKGSRRLARALREAQARLARHYAAIERADPVDVHQARVASRRIRSLLKTFRAHFRRDRAVEYRRELGRAARRLGPLRELDVLASHPGMGSHAVARALASARRAEVSRLQRSLRGARRRRAAVFDGPSIAQLGLDPNLTRGDVERTIRGQWRRVERLLAANPIEFEALHELRISLKNMRYIFEMEQKNIDQNGTAMLACLRATQAVLGAERDAACARVWLEQSTLPKPVVRAALRRVQRQSVVLAGKRPGVLRKLGRVGRRWYQSAR